MNRDPADRGVPLRWGGLSKKSHLHPDVPDDLTEIIDRVAERRTELTAFSPWMTRRGGRLPACADEPSREGSIGAVDRWDGRVLYFRHSPTTGSHADDRGAGESKSSSGETATYPRIRQESISNRRASRMTRQQFSETDRKQILELIGSFPWGDMEGGAIRGFEITFCPCAESVG